MSSVLLLTINFLLDFIHSNIHSPYFTKICPEAISDLPWLNSLMLTLANRWIPWKHQPDHVNSNGLLPSPVLRLPALTKYLNADVSGFLPLVQPTWHQGTFCSILQLSCIFLIFVMVAPPLHTWLLFWMLFLFSSQQGARMVPLTPQL